MIHDKMKFEENKNVLDIKDLKNMKNQKALKELTMPGEKIKFLRKIFQVSQGELANKLKWSSKNYIANLEHGMFELRYDKAKEIATAFNSIAKDKDIDINVSAEDLLESICQCRKRR